MSPERVTPTTTGPGQAWSAGHGPVRHTPLTRRRVSAMIAAPGERDEGGEGPGSREILHAADRIANLLDAAECAALDGVASPEGVIVPAAGS
jgi:hypothetical protein